MTAVVVLTGLAFAAVVVLVTFAAAAILFKIAARSTPAVRRDPLVPPQIDASSGRGMTIRRSITSAARSSVASSNGRAVS